MRLCRAPSAKSRLTARSGFFGTIRRKDWPLAEIATIHYRESGIGALEASHAEWGKKHDDDLFADLRAYVRGQPHEIAPGTNGETWAKHAKQLATEDPTILDARLVAAGGSGAVGARREVAGP